MTRPRSRTSSLVMLLILAGGLSGCATSMGWSPHFGVRPDEPAIKTGDDACTEYTAYSIYAQQLQEAYHSRATQNRGWIYVAAILGLAVAAASGGLAAATAVGAGTIGLLTISGGFAAGSFATINNSELAVSYTSAANSVDRALRDSRGAASCAAALLTLTTGVSGARTNLEVARTNNAAGALQRAKDQLKVLNDVIADVQAGDPTHVTLAAEIVNVAPSAPTNPPAGQAPTATPVTLTIKNIRLDEVAQADVKVLFGTKKLPLDAPAQPGADNTYTVKFTAPAARPDPATKDYAPALLVGKTEQRVGSLQGKKFTYPD